MAKSRSPSVPAWFPTVAGFIVTGGCILVVVYWAYDALGSAITGAVSTVATTVKAGFDTVTATVEDVVPSATDAASDWIGIDQVGEQVSGIWEYMSEAVTGPPPPDNWVETGTQPDNWVER